MVVTTGKYQREMREEYEREKNTSTLLEGYTQWKKMERLTDFFFWWGKKEMRREKGEQKALPNFSLNV